ncbi:MAG: hypothetical protein KF812_07235 [Fimbriimonadaceae bacterium]|nr:hypothetical protein [Fimbriimonadaceae bacterium]
MNDMIGVEKSAPMSESIWKQKVGAPVLIALIGGLAFLTLVFIGLRSFQGFALNQQTKLSDERSFPVFAGSRGLELYASDHDDSLPGADSWMDDTLPYIAEGLQIASRRDVFQTPDANSDNEFGVGMNRA